MYKQVAEVNGKLFAWHLPMIPGEMHAGYWLTLESDNTGKIEGVRVVQCLCDGCIWGKGCI
jgi:hypothetical protein